MELYILSNNDLSTLAILECSDYNINLDNQFTDKSTFRVNKTDGQIKDNFLVVNGLYQQFLFIIDEVEATDKEEKFVNLVCSDISNVFNRKIIQKDTDLMTSRSIEYFLAHMIDENFINSDDSFLNKSYVEVTYYESTQAKEATNAENGIYNFHTFMENCREHKNVFTDFKFEDGKLKVTIKHKEDTSVIIDTTLPEVTHYNKIYEQDITAKVSVYIRENDTVQNYYLKTDKTITTDKTDPDRATGAIEVISVETEDLAYSEAVNVFKGNTYKHLVEFSLNKNSKLVDPTTLYICRPITIKTPDGIYDSIISGISLQDDEYIEFKSGNIRITFIDKLKQEKENYGDKLDVTGGVIKGDLTTKGNTTIDGTATATFFTPQFYELDLESLSTNNFYPVTFPKPAFDLPLDCEIHSPSLSGSSQYNQNIIHFRVVTSGWNDTPPLFNVYEYNVYDSNEITIGCVGRSTRRCGDKKEGECVWLRGGMKYRFVSNFKPVLHTTNYSPDTDVVYSVGTNYYGGSSSTNINVEILFTPNSTLTYTGSFLQGKLHTGGKIFADRQICNLKYCNSTEAAGNLWTKLCNINFDYHVQGEFVYMKIFISNGQNGYTTQSAYIDLYMQLGWTGSNNGRFGCNAVLHPLSSGFTLNNARVKVIYNNYRDYDVWVYAGYNYSRANYIVETEGNVTITKIGTCQNSEPTGTACDLAMVQQDDCSPIMVLPFTTSVSSKTLTISFSKSGGLIDSLCWCSFHAKGSNYLGGSILFNIGYTGQIVSSVAHNNSGYSVTLGGNANGTMTITIKDDSITTSTGFDIRLYKFRNYMMA